MTASTAGQHGPKMHAILAVEKSLIGQRDKLIGETKVKFSKPEFFKGYIKTLKMLVSNPANDVLEKQATESKQVPTSVLETLQYAFRPWIQAEDNQLLKNIGNQLSSADIMFQGKVLIPNCPIDSIMGLENRITDLREVINTIPTLDASRDWEPDAQRGHGYFVDRNPEDRVKTERKTVPVVLAAATDKHPAQVKESTEDHVVGLFTTKNFSSAITSAQKAQMMSTVDELIVEIKKARTLANETTVQPRQEAQKIIDLLLSPLKAVTTAASQK